MTQFRAKTPFQIAQYLLSHEKKVMATFWLGAGASVSAGIPDAETLADQILSRFIYLSPESYSEDSGVSRFAHYFSILSPASRRMFLHEIFSGVKQANSTHLLLARMIRDGWANTALTSNFDNLLTRAMRMTGLLNPWIVDMHRDGETVSDSLSTGSVIYFNGPEDNHRSYAAHGEIERIQGSIRQAIFRAAQDSVFIVLGYSGRKDPLFDILAEVPHFAHGLFWVTKDGEPEDHVKEKILRSDLYSEFLGGWDADRFMYELVVKGLNLPDSGIDIPTPAAPAPPPPPPPAPKPTPPAAPKKVMTEPAEATPAPEPVAEAGDEQELLDEVQELVVDIDDAMQSDFDVEEGADDDVYDGADDDDDEDEEFVVRSADVAIPEEAEAEPGDEEEIPVEPLSDDEVVVDVEAVDRKTSGDEPQAPDVDIFADIDESIFQLGEELDIDLDADEEELIRKLGLNGHSLDISDIDEEPEIPPEVEAEVVVDEAEAEPEDVEAEIEVEAEVSEAAEEAAEEAVEEAVEEKAEPAPEGESAEETDREPEAKDVKSETAEGEQVEDAAEEKTESEDRSINIKEIIDKAHEALVIGGSEELVELAISALGLGANQAYPALTEALLDWGDEQFSAGFFSKARQAVEKAREMSPEDPVVYARLRDIAAKMGDDQYAAEMGEKAAELQKESGKP